MAIWKLRMMQLWREQFFIKVSQLDVYLKDMSQKPFVKMRCVPLLNMHDMRRCCKGAVSAGSKQHKHHGCCCTCCSQSWLWQRVWMSHQWSHVSQCIGCASVKLACLHSICSISWKDHMMNDELMERTSSCCVATWRRHYIGHKWTSERQDWRGKM